LGYFSSKAFKTGFLGRLSEVNLVIVRSADLESLGERRTAFSPIFANIYIFKKIQSNFHYLTFIQKNDIITKETYESTDRKMIMEVGHAN